VYLTDGSLALGEGRLTEAILNCQRAFDLTAGGRWPAEQKAKLQREAHAGLAAAYEARRDWASARTHLTALLDGDPKNAPARMRLARALFFLGKPDDAYAELQTAVRDDPSLDPPTVAMGKLWTAKGDAPKAREWLDRAIKAEPNSARVHLAYADWLLQQNETEPAKIHADTAAKIKADDVEVQKIQGLVGRVQGDLAGAEKVFRRVLADAPGDFFASNQLALVLADQSDKEQRGRAVQLAEVNARQYPRSPEALATLGYAYYRVGNLDGALQDLQAAVKAGSGQAAPDTAYYLALVLFDRDKFEDARKLLEGALGTKGLFVYRKQAEALLEKLKLKEPAKDKPKAP
jgi:uncharacterized protein (TIGR02996 family)